MSKMTVTAPLKAVLLLLLLAGCSGNQDAKFVCTLDGEAYLIEARLSWVVRRVPSADRLCPKQ